jgi:1-deoxy-D-xylulose-5-phosphate reductoisomerase
MAGKSCTTFTCTCSVAKNYEQFAPCISFRFSFRFSFSLRVKALSILGSTGSIGTQTLDIIAAKPDEYSLVWLTTNARTALLEEQIRRHKPLGVVVTDEAAWREFKRTTSFQGTILCGEAGLREAASDTRAEMIVSALVGFSGVLPTHDAITSGIAIALANKETLVSAGAAITAAAQAHNVPIFAVDSEHSAIVQCLVGEQTSDIEKLIITASGGPFRNASSAELATVTRAQALKHPNWTMGAKITIDSATLMNKGLEVIEAYWLFGVDAERIEVVVHPQSIIHSMVQFVDGSVKAQLGLPDMKIPIAYALSFPRHSPLDATLVPRLDLTALADGTLTFHKPDMERFPCLRLAFDALRTGGTAPAVLNAANEIAVSAFLREGSSFGFMDIPRVVERALSTIAHKAQPSLDDIVATDAETRSFVSTLCSKHPLKQARK